MGSCSKCNSCLPPIISLHRKISDLDWDQLKRKLHSAIDNPEPLELKEIEFLINKLEEINYVYELALEKEIQKEENLDMDVLFEEYKIIKEKEDEISMKRKDEILMIFDKNGVEIVDEGYLSWIVQRAEF